MNEHEHFMQIALEQAEDALAHGEFPVGSVIVHEGRVVASGQRRHTLEQKESVNEIDHAEVLALRSLLARETAVDPSELVVYATMEPCLMCFSTLILNGIRRIVYAYEDVMGGGTNLPLAQLNPLYAKMEVTVIPHVMRQQSLGLFQRFFANPENQYWKDSLLANYTLNQ
ncbi:MAG: nucleoside deaminase [Proteobacteria bacterium]|nr:nucleoside deaminase [Pseudomonadota bacterium]MBU1231823.1 nucleoside deaminase [Pseudomonadota bacterium]MBU1419982.1 nucleoside deaminase [Pseudomonadota bacterium]MBU1454765.1 nucleoside deaminase [Pseudomonadota bacterium]